MMNSFVRTVGVACLACVVGLASEAQGAATMSLKAVRKNGVAIPLTNSLSVARGDTVTAEVYIFGWGTPPFDPPTNSGLVQTYNATILGASGSFSSGANSANNATLVLPVGWQAPVVKDQCPCDVAAFPDCDTVSSNAYGCIKASHCTGGTNAGGICIATSNCPGGTCDLTGHNPATMATLDFTRPDFIFAGFSNFNAVDVSSLNVRYAATINGSDGQIASRCQGGSVANEQCSTNANCPGGTCNPNYLHYAGTLNLKVGTAACGTYTFNFSSEAALTFIGNPEALPIQVVPAREALTLTVTAFPSCPQIPVGACCNTTNPDAPTCSITQQANCSGTNLRYGGDGSTCANINPPCAVPSGACCIDASGTCTDGVTQANCTGRFGGVGSTCANINPPCTPPANAITGVSPANCLIDARRPFPPNQAAQRQGFNSMTLTFQNPPGAGENAANDFQLTQVPATTPPFPPTITSVGTPVGNSVTLTFSAPIQPNKWTCVRHIASNGQRCIGYLPADANSNRAALPNDILDIIDSLNGIRNPLLQIHQCDIDRSGVCAPADIITEIDLLNGVNGYPVQNGRTLEACPSAP